jgi:hypothetical protein
MDIQIKSWTMDGIVRGRKAIYVNGEMWGAIRMDSHGSIGATYTFWQAGGTGAIYDPEKQNHVKVYGDKMHIRRMSDGEAFKPLPERLQAMAVSLIERGLLVCPKPFYERKEAAQRALELEKEERRLEEQREFEARAREALDGAGGEFTVLRVVEAMRWARSR